MCVGQLAILAAAPLLFNVALKGKFESGLAVLPWTLAYCTWFAMALIVQNYLWCAEKAYLSSIALAAGVVANVGLNLLLLPPLGLLGAVLATTAANALALALICLFIGRLGFRFDAGVRVILGLPMAICLGPWLALAVLAIVAAEALWSNTLLSDEERSQLRAGLGDYLARMPWRTARQATAPGA